MALEELGANHESTSTPMAKGRTERLFRFFQDRLLKEIRFRGIRDYQSGNHFLLEEFLPWHHERYALEVKSAYQNLPRGTDLGLIFS